LSILSFQLKIIHWICSLCSYCIDFATELLKNRYSYFGKTAISGNGKHFKKCVLNKPSIVQYFCFQCTFISIWYLKQQMNSPASDIIFTTWYLQFFLYKSNKSLDELFLLVILYCTLKLLCASLFGTISDVRLNSSTRALTFCARTQDKNVTIME